MRHILSVEGLKTYFKYERTIAKVVDDVSFYIDKSESFALVGESGCGKTLTALSIIQLIPEPGFIAGGKILLHGRDIISLSEEEKRKIRGNKISMVFQEPMTSLNPVLTIGEQISEVMRIHQHLSRREAKKAAIEVLSEVGIPNPKERYNIYPHQLSGGMKQRVMIGIAVCCRPDLLIADEPTTALDVTIQEQILNLIRRLRHDTGTSLLLITHDLAVVYRNADRIGVMYAGKLIESATSDELFNNPLHPYTKKLFNCIPSKKKRGLMLQSIEGDIPEPTSLLNGCRFRDRCSYASDICGSVEPILCEVKNGHSVACHLYRRGEKKIAIFERIEE
ncbi:MAG: ABC transporter ATP-binding protein, partial [Nitrospirae bacterium]